MDIFGIEFSDDSHLIEIGAEGKKHTNEINKEWRKRHGLNFPYILTEDGVLVNQVLGAFVGDKEVDSRILEQAEELRKTRKITGK